MRFKKFATGGSTDDSQLIDFTKSFETFRSKPYVVNGQTLIGYGSANPTLIAKGEITEQEAANEVANKYKYLRNIAEKSIPNWTNLSRDVQYALLDTMYNGGEQSVLSKSPKLMQLLRDGVTDGAALSVQMDHSKSAGGWLGVRSAARRAMAQGKYNWEWTERDKYGRQVDRSLYKGPEDWRSSPYYGKYQQGGNLIYQPFGLPKTKKSSAKQREETLEDWMSSLFSFHQTPFPVEPVSVAPVSTTQSHNEEPVSIVKQRGSTQYKSDDINVGNMREFLDKLEEAGISVRVTSATREGAKTKSGNTSRHATGDAIDITPIKGQTFEDLKRQFQSNPELLAYMRENGYGIIDETDPLIKAKTGATGDHWHISRGGERFAIYGFNQLFG